MPTDRQREPSVMSGFGWAMGLSAELVVTTGVGSFLGWLVDRWLNTRLVFLMIGALLGGAGGMLNVYRQWMKRS